MSSIWKMITFACIDNSCHTDLEPRETSGHIRETLAVRQGQSSPGNPVGKGRSLMSCPMGHRLFGCDR